MAPYNMFALVIRPVLDAEDEETRRDEMKTRLGPDYTVLPAGQEISDDDAAA